ncbi:MAG: DUF2490 domain-containing protein [Cryomorphaceae bacterium]|nr:DUF2490 domain-containing protein [Cryomorphaceae bacterium]
MESFGLAAQNTELWGGYITTTKLNEKFSLWNDFHYVTNAFWANRHGITYELHKYVGVSAGYAYVTTATPFTNDFIRDEDRIWWQVVGRLNITKDISYRYRWRHDLRFRKALVGEEVLDEKLFYHRTRILTDFRFMLKRFSKDRRIHVDIMDEILFNFGKNVPDGLDQNRFYLMGGFSNRHITVLAGYSLRSIPRQIGYVHNQGFTVWVIHAIKRRQEKM